MTRIVMLALLAGCATVTTISSPEGKTAFSVNCGGKWTDWGLCYQKAGEVCPRGYALVDRVGDSQSTGIFQSQGGMLSSSSTRTLIVQCKD